MTVDYCNISSSYAAPTNVTYASSSFLANATYTSDTSIATNATFTSDTSIAANATSSASGPVNITATTYYALPTLVSDIIEIIEADA